jgi:hypothetical protein
MANKKITELTELTSAGQNDVLPIVDLVAVETKKIKLSGLKASLNLQRSDVGLSEVDNTSDINKPISNSTQLALDLKADDSDLQTHINDTANPHSVTKDQVGLSNVNNTSDLDKPISTATQTALSGKQDSLGFVPEDSANKGASNGYAPLVNGIVPSANLPDFVHDKITITLTDISNGYVYLSKTAIHDSVNAHVNRTSIFQVDDYSMVDVLSPDVTRIDFNSVLQVGGALELQVGDILRFYYVEKQI